MLGLWCFVSLLTAVAAHGILGSADVALHGGVRVPSVPVKAAGGPPSHPCDTIDSTAELLRCESATHVDLSDCSKVGDWVYAPYLTSVATFVLDCDVTLVYLPVLATVTERIQTDLYRGQSFHIAAMVQYVYLFSLHSVAGKVSLALLDRTEVLEAPYLYQTKGLSLSINLYGAMRAKRALNSSARAAKDDDLCKVPTLTSAQVKALQLSCGLGNVNWDTKDGADSQLLFDAAAYCQATSMRSGTFLNVPSDFHIPKLNCRYMTYIGDSKAPFAPVLTVKNSVMTMAFDDVSVVYGGVFLAAFSGSVSFNINSDLLLSGLRSYLAAPDDLHDFIMVPKGPDSTELVRCRLTTAGQFVAFSPNSLQC